MGGGYDRTGMIREGQVGQGKRREKRLTEIGKWTKESHVKNGEQLIITHSKTIHSLNEHQNKVTLS